MNQYPKWKSVLVIVMTLFGLLYALPNIYGADPVVQVRQKAAEEAKPGAIATFDAAIKTKILKGLDDAKIPYQGAPDDNNGVLTIRFADTDLQLKAMDVVNSQILGQDERYSAALNLISSAPKWLSAIGAKAMNLGLDLRGGVHFLMQVDMDAAIRQFFDRLVGDFKVSLVEKKIRYLSVETDGKSVEIRFRAQEDLDKAVDEFQRSYPELTFDKNVVADQFNVKVSASPRVLLDEKKKAIHQNIATLQNRVNELGVAEPIIQQQGQDRIVVELPGIQDPVRAREIIGAAATLEFRLVSQEGDAFDAERSGRVPAGTKLYKDKSGMPILLKKQVIVTGDQIADATSTIDQNSNQPAVSITLKGAGGNIMRKITSENVNKPMAVVFIEDVPVMNVVNGKTVRTLKHNEQVINVATIREEFGRRFQITGLDKPGEARDLSLFLRAGSLAAPMYVAEESTVGPSLGKENIARGVRASLLGFVLVVIAMAIYYKTMGMIANIALFMNLLILLAVMSCIQATLTLPGIAGIALTLGIAIDANVLICERIREELRNGSSAHAAIHMGYDRAFATILDAHVTTLVGTILLFSIGSGPIRGFALSLTIGLLASLFTSVMCTRAMVHWTWGNRRLKTVSV